MRERLHFVILLCGWRYQRQRLHCSVELKRRVAERGRSSRGGRLCFAWCDFQGRTKKSIPYLLMAPIVSVVSFLLLLVPLLCVPYDRSGFSPAAHLTWNSLPPAVWNCDSLSLSLSLSLLLNPDLKLTVFYCFLLTILPTCSASASVAA